MKLKDVLLAGLAGGLAALLVVVVAGLVGSQSANPLGGSRFPNGISADSTNPSAGQVRGTTLTITGAATGATLDLSGEGRLALVDEGTLVTLGTGATSSITAAQACDGNVLNRAPIAIGSTTTLPASSAWVADCLTVNGDAIQFLFRNTSSTDTGGTTIVAGDASTTLLEPEGGDVLIEGAQSAIINVWRVGTDTLVVGVDEYLDAD